MKRTLCLLAVLFSLSLHSQDTPKVNFKLKFLDRFDPPSFETVDSFSRLQIMIAGNIWQVPAQQKLFYNKTSGKSDFKEEFRYIQPIFHISDLVIGNLRSSFGNNPESEYNVPDEFALALKFAGINNLVNANYATANCDKFALERTRKLLGYLDMDVTGVYAGNIERNAYNPLIIEKKGFRIALLNYTSLPDRPSISANFILNLADKTLLSRDLYLARAQKADFVIVYFDWSDDTKEAVQAYQENLVKYCIENGADLIVGGSPSLAKRMQPYDIVKGGESRSGLVVYSLGNLCGNPALPGGKGGAILDIELRKNNFTGDCRMSDFGFIPVYNYYDSLSANPKMYVLPVSAIESGEIMKDMPFVEKRRAINVAYALRKLYGTVSDEMQYNLTDRAVFSTEEMMSITRAPINNKTSVFRPEKLGDLQTTLRDILPPKPAAASTTAAIGSKTAPPIALPERAPQRKSADNDTVYCIQFYSLPRPTHIDTFYYDHLAGYRIEEDGQGNYLYLLGQTPYFSELYSWWKEQIRPRYRRSFIAAYYRGRRVKEFPSDF